MSSALHTRVAAARFESAQPTTLREHPLQHQVAAPCQGHAAIVKASPSDRYRIQGWDLGREREDNHPRSPGPQPRDW